MSYAPLYAKLHELEERLIKIETLPPAMSLPAPLLVDSSTGIDLTSLLNECTLNSSSITQLSNTIAMLATKTELPDVSGFATKIELPDVSGFATKAELPDVSGFATKAELPDVSGFATKAELPDVSGFATKAELPDVSGFATKVELPDVSGFATKVELPDVSGFATKEELVPLATKDELVSKDELANLFAKFDNIINVVAQLNTRIDDLYTKIPVSA
jgi:hypothetical protein